MQTVKVCQFSNNSGGSGSLYISQKDRTFHKQLKNNPVRLYMKNLLESARGVGIESNRNL